MLVQEIMQKASDLVTCRPGEPVMEAARMMERSAVGCVLVTDNGILRGLVTDRDLAIAIVALDKSSRNTPVSEVMTAPVTTAGPDLELMEAARIMAKKKIRRLPIQRADGALEGIVSLADMARVLRQELDSLLSIEMAPTIH